MLYQRFCPPALAALLLLSCATLTQTSCSPGNKSEAATGSDQAYQDFQTFVSDTEAKAAAVANQPEADYERETTQLRTDFDARVAAVDKYADPHDEARRREVEALRTRYTAAYDKRTAAWTNRLRQTGATSPRALEAAKAGGKAGGAAVKASFSSKDDKTN